MWFSTAENINLIRYPRALEPLSACFEVLVRLREQGILDTRVNNLTAKIAKKNIFVVSVILKLRVSGDAERVKPQNPSSWSFL